MHKARKNKLGSGGEQIFLAALSLPQFGLSGQRCDAGDASSDRNERELDFLKLSSQGLRTNSFGKAGEN